MANTPKAQKSKEELRKEYKLKMERQRKVRRVLVMIAICAVAVIAGVILSLTVFFKISTVEVRGSTQYTDTEVVTVCGVNQGDNLFLVNTDKVEEHVSQALPFTGEITAKRSFPNKIVITVTDSKVSSAVKYDKGYALVNDQEKVLATAKNIKEVNTILKEQDEKRLALETAAKTTEDATASTTAEKETTTATSSTGETTTAAGESTTTTTVSGTGTSSSESTTATTTATATATAAKTGQSSTKSTIKNSATQIDSSIMLLTGLKVEEANPGYQLKVSNENIFESYEEIMAALEEYGISDITAMDLSSPSDISLTYQNRIVMMIGSVSGLEKKLQMAAAVLEEQNSVSTELKGTIDLTISGRAYFSEGTSRTTKATTVESTESASSVTGDTTSTTASAESVATTSSQSSATTASATTASTTAAVTSSSSTTNVVY